MYEALPCVIWWHYRFPISGVTTCTFLIRHVSSGPAVTPFFIPFDRPRIPDSNFKYVSRPPIFSSSRWGQSDLNNQHVTDTSQLETPQTYSDVSGSIHERHHLQKCPRRKVCVRLDQKRHIPKRILRRNPAGEGDWVDDDHSLPWIQSRALPLRHQSLTIWENCVVGHCHGRLGRWRGHSLLYVILILFFALSRSLSLFHWLALFIS